MVASYCYFFRVELFLLERSRSGVGSGVGVDICKSESQLELESLEIRQLRSPAQLHGIKSDINQVIFLTHSLKPIIKLEVSGRGKMGQECFAFPKSGPLCPSILVDELFGELFQPISSALGSSDLFCPNRS